MVVLIVLSFYSEPDSFLPLFSSWVSQASMPVFWCEASLPLSRKAVRLPSLKGLPFPLYMPSQGMAQSETQGRMGLFNERSLMAAPAAHMLD